MLRSKADNNSQHLRSGDPNVHPSDDNESYMEHSFNSTSHGVKYLESETQSEEDYDENFRPKIISALGSQVQRRKKHKERLGGLQNSSTPHSTARGDTRGDDVVKLDSRSHFESNPSNPHQLLPRQRQKIKAFIFSRQVSTFDAQSEAAVNSPFHGFYNLFWLSVALLICRISANNWRTYGNLLGPSDILKTMFRRDVVVLLLSDGIMCGLTAATWLLQKLVLAKMINWDREGWIMQHLWQTSFIAGTVKWTVYRDWPWTHTVFFVLHALVMLMKQHSYAFYNGHLSAAYHRRQLLVGKLKKLSITHLSTSLPTKRHSNDMSPDLNFFPTDVDNMINVIDTSQTLCREQVSQFESAIIDELASLADELQGTASDPSRAYPHNLTFIGHYQWLPLPTVVYELEYPRLNKIKWSYVAEKVAAMIGIIFVMIQVSQYYIYPVVLVTIEMRENGMPLIARFREFPWLLGDLLFPFMMEYLLTWYLIWETVLNILAELTYFADRHFYDAWWNSVSWDQFARDWNRPVHIFLLRHVYHSSISSLKVNKHAATIITFFLSAYVSIAARSLESNELDERS
ncbi:putative sterol O-acyltransferase 1 [Beauveria bassiana]|nr:putative sterol O-acyltransferase 1 [Beauveria bassiana]